MGGRGLFADVLRLRSKFMRERDIRLLDPTALEGKLFRLQNPQNRPIAMKTSSN